VNYFSYFNIFSLPYNCIFINENATPTKCLSRSLGADESHYPYDPAHCQDCIYRVVFLLPTTINRHNAMPITQLDTGERSVIHSQLRKFFTPNSRVCFMPS